MDYEYDDEPYEARILWGRIAVYGVAFLMVFLLGSCWGGRGTVDEAELAPLEEQIRVLASENEGLERRIAAREGGQAPTPTPTPGESPTPGADDGGDTTDTAAADGMRTYTVESGDNLYGIAVKVYGGDGSKYRLIAEENGLDSNNPLTVGQQLRIPPAD